MYLLKKILVLPFTLSLGLYFLLPSLETRALDIADWPSFGFKAVEVLAYSGQEMIALDKNNRGYRVNFNTRESSTLAGRFKVLRLEGDSRVWALSRLGNLYSFSDPMWRKFKLKYKIENFSVTSLRIYSIYKGRLNIFDKKGKTRSNKNLSKLKNLKSFFSRGKNGYVFLTKNGQLTSLIGERKKIIEKGVEKILFFGPNYFAVKKKKNGAVVLYYNPLSKLKRLTFTNSAGVNAMTLSGYGYLLASNGVRVFKSTFTLAELLGRGRKTYVAKRLKFRKLKKITALKIFGGVDGIFRKTGTGDLQFWSHGKKKFLYFPGRVSELSISGNSELWAINMLGRIFHYRSGDWEQKNGLARSISARGDHVLIVDETGKVEKYDWKGKRFRSLGIKAKSVHVQNQYVFWVIGPKNEIFRCRKKCRRISGYARKLSISAEGVVFAIGKKYRLLRFDGKKFSPINTKAKLITDIASSHKGDIWLLDDAYEIHAPHDYLKPKQTVRTLRDFGVSGRIEEHVTIGEGHAILHDKKFHSRDLKLSANAPNGGFKFKARMRRKAISNSHYFLDLSMGRNGRLWALTSTKVYKYHEKSGRFKEFTKTNFTRPEHQKYLALPRGVTVSSIISDKEDRLWVVKAGNSREVYWQEKKKGRFVKTVVGKPPDAKPITDITVDVSGNVFVAAGQIYKFNYKRKKFDKYKKLNKGDCIRLSSGPSGTLWVVDNKGNLYEQVAGKMEKRPKRGSFTAQDIDISNHGIVYATTKTHKTQANEPGAGQVVNPARDRLCQLRKYNSLKGKFEKVGKPNEHFSQFVAVAADGTPWMTCAPSGSNTVYRGEK